MGGAHAISEHGPVGAVCWHDGHPGQPFASGNVTISWHAKFSQNPGYAHGFSRHSLHSGHAEQFLESNCCTGYCPTEQRRHFKSGQWGNGWHS